MQCVVRGRTAEFTHPEVTVHPKDVERLNRLFDLLDRNEDGGISRAELIKAMKLDHEVWHACQYASVDVRLLPRRSLPQFLAYKRAKLVKKATQEFNSNDFFSRWTATAQKQSRR